MARSVEDMVQLQLGGQALQIARLVAENEALREKVTELEKSIVREPDNKTTEKKPIHLVNDKKEKE